MTLGCLIVQSLIFGHLGETSIVCKGCRVSLDKRSRGSVLHGLSVNVAAKVRQENVVIAKEGLYWKAAH